MANEDMVVTHWHVKQGIIITVVCCGGQRDGNGVLNVGQSKQEESRLGPMGMWGCRRLHPWIRSSGRTGLRCLPVCNKTFQLSLILYC